jgi:hypothetical protein
MDKIKEIIRRIEDGFVFDEHGRWIYMAEQRIYERRVIEQIVNGNVLVDGKWVAIGEARRLAARGKAAAKRQPLPTAAAQTPIPPTPVTPLLPPAETVSFETTGDMMETICMDMSAIMKPAEATEPEPAHIDSVLLYGLSQKNSAADQSRHAIEYIDGLTASRKRGWLFGILAKLSIVLAAAAAILLVFMQYVDL